jgi:hypothetical protein
VPIFALCEGTGFTALKKRNHLPRLIQGESSRGSLAVIERLIHKCGGPTFSFLEDYGNLSSIDARP